MQREFYSFYVEGRFATAPDCFPTANLKQFFFFKNKINTQQ